MDVTQSVVKSFPLSIKLLGIRGRVRHGRSFSLYIGELSGHFLTYDISTELHCSVSTDPYLLLGE